MAQNEAKTTGTRLNFPAITIPVLVYLGGLVYFLSASVFSITDFPLDDGWIHRVYSRSLAFFKGFQYNPGAQEAGETSPLWAIISAPAHWVESLGTEAVVVAVKAITIGLGLLCLWVMFKLVERLTQSKSIAVISVSLFALEPRFLFSSLSGMETNLLLALWLLGVLAFTREKWLWACLCFGLAPLARPEALLLLPAAAIGVLVWGGWKRLKQPLLWAALGLPSILWALFCLSVNGHLLPNTFYAKVREIKIGFMQVRGAWAVFTQHGYASGVVFGLGAAVFLLLLWRKRKDERKGWTFFLFIVAVPVFYMAGVAVTRLFTLHGYYWTRWFDPGSSMLTIGFCIGLGVLFGGRGNLLFSPAVLQWLEGKNRYLARWGMIGVTLLFCLVSETGFERSFNQLRGRLASDSRSVYMMNVRAGEWVKEYTSPEAVVGVSDAGAIRFFGERRVVDLGGLNSKEIAFKKVSVPEAAKKVDWLVLFAYEYESLKKVLGEKFEVRKVFRMSLREYTIAKFPGQAVLLVLKRR